MPISMLLISGLLTVVISIALVVTSWLEMLAEPLRMSGLILLAVNSVITVLFIWHEKRNGGRKSELLSQLSSNSPEWQQARRQLETELQQEINRLEQKSQKLADRYRSLHEWMDYPNILDINTGASLWSESESGETVPRLQMSEQDRRVKEILARQAEQIYEKIRKNSYSEAGQLQPMRLRDDFLNIAMEVAHVYQPNLSQPLLSTSPEQIARALNRIGLHLLVIMDQLPVDLKSYNIQKTYDTVRQAITAYGAYKKAAPYLDWASKGIYLGRMVSTSNPVTLGLFWGATELGKYGAKKLATHLIDRQAIGLLQSLIEVIGYEVAGIYGGNIRHRDANWCYAVELTQILAVFPVSRESLQFGYRELSRLQLKNEYDRLCAFRCLAAGKVLDRRQTYPELLNREEKKEIVSQLESAYQNVLHGKGNAQVEAWRQQVQDHLGIKLQLERTDSLKLASDANRKPAADVRFLAEFLHHMKMIPITELPQTRVQLLTRIKGEKTAHALLSEPFPQEMLAAIAADQHRLQPPDREPSDPLLETFLKLLADANANFAPWSPEAELLILELGLYYRKEYAELSDLLLQSYRDHLLHQHPHIRDVMKGKPLSAFRALCYLIQERNLSPANVTAIYEHIKIIRSVASQEISEQSTDQKFLLFVAQSEAYLVTDEDLPEAPFVVWETAADTSWENVSSLILASLKIRGGRWLTEALQSRDDSGQEIQVEAPLSARFHTYFEPLTSFLKPTQH